MSPKTHLRSRALVAACSLLTAAPALLLPPVAHASPAGPAPAVSQQVTGSAGARAAGPAGLSAAAPAAPTKAEALTSQITDDARILDHAAAQAAIDDLADRGIKLWVVTKKVDAAFNEAEYPDQVEAATGLGNEDLLLVIYVSSSGSHFSLQGCGDSPAYRPSQKDQKRLNNRINRALASDDYNEVLMAVREAKGLGLQIGPLRIHDTRPVLVIITFVIALPIVLVQRRLHRRARARRGRSAW